MAVEKSTSKTKIMGPIRSPENETDFIPVLARNK